ncbi:MAG: alpha/beta fold hydrolase [Proteobacteria bacterium]|nr:alpha/beta fold hydrolase [Pseudomonadota bacterium]
MVTESKFELETSMICLNKKNAIKAFFNHHGIMQKTVMVALLFVLSLWMYACERQDEIPLLQDHFVTLPNGDVMHYLETGNPDGKPILFVHGYPTSAFLYRNIITRIAPDENSPYRCISISHIGFGKSSCPGDGSIISPLYEVDRLEEFIELMNLDNFAAVIHDWGGPIGAAATLRQSDRMSHLIILNTMLAFPEISFLDLESIMGFTNGFFSQPRPLIEMVYPDAVKGAMQLLSTSVMSDAVLETYAEPFRGTDDECKCKIRAGINLFSKAHTEIAIFEEIKENAVAKWSDKPAVFLWGTNDPLLGAITGIGIDAHKAMESIFPQAETMRIKGASHFMQEDKPDEIADRIIEFIEL